MGKFDKAARTPTQTGPVATTGRTVTAEGGPGWSRDVKSELFLLAVTNMVGEQTFYEASGDRDSRFAELVRQATVQDPDWTARLIRWLRADANMRSASLVAAAEYARAGGPNVRAVVASALQRPDEPGEFIAYWHARYGRTLAGGKQRGLADAAVRLFDERAALKYDGVSHAYRLGDVIELTHPKPSAAWQHDLFRWLLDRRHGRTDPRVGETLSVVRARAAAEAVPAAGRRALLAGMETQARAEFVRAAGGTWEWLAGWLQGPMDALAWETVIPSMGLMALTRNLRNFDEAGVSDAVAAQVAARLADPEQVAKSRQFPLRFLSAFKAAPSLRWAWPLEQAVQHSLANVPALPGRTLVMVDVSASMDDALSARSELRRWEAAALFGAALALRAGDADLWAYSSQGHNARHFGLGPAGSTRRTRITPAPGGSVLPLVQQFRSCPSFGGGTETAAALTESFAGHDRVVLLTDEQAGGWWAGDPGTAVPAKVPLVTFNLAGYQAGHAEAGPNRVTVGGLTDAGFRMLDMLDRRASGDWPF